jgi:4-hydroxy-2-oxoheptanedioate aldolase
MRKSRTLEALRAGRPVLCTKINTADPVVVDIIGLTGFDLLWICTEHTSIGADRLGHLIRTAGMNGMDTMVRVSKGSYSDYIRPLELGATGLMVPHCKSGEEARAIGQTTRFHPIGRRPLDGGNSDGNYCLLDLPDYLRLANENTFIVVQIEDPEAIDQVEAIAAAPGIDALFVGPGDLSHGLGFPGQTNHPVIQRTIERVAAACAANGKWWGLPVSPTSAPRYLEMGARLLASGADVHALTGYFRQVRADFERLGIEFHR